jgi:NAD(P)-dependent dehydrogenase (short-subunit alcohol dehydrogenase family)
MKTVLITGANKSIGFETAKLLLQQDYYVFLGSRDSAKGHAAVNQLNNEGYKNVEAVTIDVSSDNSIDAAQMIISQKTNSLDVLINNAGISGGFPQPSSSTDIHVIREVFDTNFFGAIKTIQTFLPMLQKSEQPRIVNVTSGLASLTLHSDPNWQYYQVKGAAYGPSKTALNAYTVMLAYELKDSKFKVNAVDPGYTATDFNHHHGPKNVVDAAAFVARFATLDENGPSGKFFSEDNNPVTGESIW